MIRNELYKIITQKSIICFIVFFCIFNGIYLAYEQQQLPKESYENIIKETLDIKEADRKNYLESTISILKDNYEDEKIIDEYEKALNYLNQINEFDDYIDSITHSDEKGLNSLLYSKESFATKNKEAIKKEYIKKNMAQVKLVYGNYVAIEKSTSIGMQDIFLIFIVLLLTIILLTREKESGMIKLQKANVNGRTKQILSKQIAGIIFVSVLSIVIYVETFVINSLLYGTGSLKAPIQSVNGFFASTLKVNILQYILLFVILKIVGICVFMFIAYIVCNIFKNTISTCIAYSIVIFIEYILYVSIGEFSNISILKYFNICSILNVQDYTKGYTNLNIFNNPIPYGRGIAFEIAFLIIFAVTINIVVFNKPIKDRKAKRLSIFKMQTNHSLCCHELYKTLINNKIILMIIAVAIIQIFTYKNITVYNDAVDHFYNIYVEKINGTNDSKAESLIKKEESKFDKFEQELIDAEAALNSGKITEMGYETIQSEYNAHKSEMEAFEQLLEQREYLTKLENNKKIKGWFLNEKAYRKIFYMDDTLTEFKDGLLMLSLLVMIIIPMIVIDKEKKLDILFSSTKLGRKALWNKKIISACTSGVLVFAAVYAPRYYYVINNLGYKATIAPIQSIKEYYNFPLKLSVHQFLLFEIVLKLLCVIFLAITILSISAYSKTLVSAIVSCVGAVVLLSVPIFLGFGKMYSVLFVPLLVLNRTVLHVNGYIVLNLIITALGMIWIFVSGRNKFCKIGK